MIWGTGGGDDDPPPHPATLTRSKASAMHLALLKRTPVGGTRAFLLCHLLVVEITWNRVPQMLRHQKAKCQRYWRDTGERETAGPSESTGHDAAPRAIQLPIPTYDSSRVQRATQFLDLKSIMGQATQAVPWWCGVILIMVAAISVLASWPVPVNR